MKKKAVVCFLFQFISLLAAAQSTLILSGFIKEKGSSETLPRANISVLSTGRTFTSNNYGFYSLSLPAGSYKLRVSTVGFETLVFDIDLQKDKKQDIELQAGNQLSEVEITAGQQEGGSRQLSMSRIDIPISQIKDIPALLGEKDVFKVIKLMPGVQKGSEGSSGFYVRGGGPDQNLIILDDAVVYNASHLFGFFSIFNGDALKSVELIKGGFPARYGERLSSVLNLNMKDGNKEELHGEAGIGLLSSRLTLEGPLSKNKSSFLLSARRTYADLIARPFMPKDEKSGYYFYDLNAKAHFLLSQSNKLYLSGYMGSDKLLLRFKEEADDEKTNLNWGNTASTLRWNHLFSQKLFSNASFIYSNYKLNTSYDERYKEFLYKSDYTSSIRDLSFKYDVDYYPSALHTIKAGLKVTWHRFKPSALTTNDTQLQLHTQDIEVFDSYEYNAYAEDEWNISERLGINAGLRASLFSTQGTNFYNVEPRVSLRYLIGPLTGIKGSYVLMNQYLHLLSNTGIGLPTDLWVPSLKSIRPERSHQIALGLSRDLSAGKLQLSIESYYKRMENIISYKEGATFLKLDDFEKPERVPFENNVTSGKGESYGAEVLLQRKAGRLSGWIGYTLSWTRHQFEQLNQGEEFYPLHDRRHDLSVVALYSLNKSIKLNAAFVLASGNATSLITGDYAVYEPSLDRNGTFTQARELYVENYGMRGSYKTQLYHRMDAGIQFHKQRRRYKRVVELSVYNAYNRMNPFFYDVKSTYTNGTTSSRLYKYTVFPFIPSVSWSFTF